MSGKQIRFLGNKISLLTIQRITKEFRINIKELMDERIKNVKFNGIIEIDETYLPKWKFLYRFGRRIKNHTFLNYTQESWKEQFGFLLKTEMMKRFCL